MTTGQTVLAVLLLVAIAIVLGGLYVKNQEGKEKPPKVPAEQPAPKPEEKAAEKPHYRKKSLGCLGILGLIFIAVIAAYFIAYTYIYWHGDERVPKASSTQTVYVVPRTMDTPVVATPVETGVCTPAKIREAHVANPQFVVTDGIWPEWMNIPEGCKVYLDVEGNKLINKQCAYTPDKPDMSAKGEFACSSDGARWFRVQAQNASEGPVTVRPVFHK